MRSGRAGSILDLQEPAASTSCRRLRSTKPALGFRFCLRWMCCTATRRSFQFPLRKPRPWTRGCGRQRHGRRLARRRRPGLRLPSRRCSMWRAIRAGGGWRKAQARIPGLHHALRRPRSGASKGRLSASLRHRRDGQALRRLWRGDGRPRICFRGYLQPDIARGLSAAIRRGGSRGRCGGHARVQRSGRRPA